MHDYELCSPQGRPRAMLIGRGGVAGQPRPASAALSASISATAVLPAAAAVAAAPAPLAGLAQAAGEAQHTLLVAVAAARTLFVSRGSTASLRGRARAKPAAKRAAVPPATATTAAAASSSRSTGAARQAPAAPQAALAPVAAAGAAAAATQQQQQQQQLQARSARQFLAGGIAGAVSKTLVAPMERVSTILMADAQRFSLGQAVRHAWRDGLYRGHAATLIKIFPSSAIQFAVFNGLKDRIIAGKQRLEGAAGGGQQRRPAPAAAGAAPDLANHERLLAGACAGACAASLCYPLESLRTMMSVAGGARGNLLQAGRAVVAGGGVGALYKGFRASLIGDVLGNSLGFTAYEAFNRIYRDLNGGTAPPPHLRGVLGTCSAACVLTLTLPLEVVRRRLQVQGLAGRPVLYRGTLDCIRQILRKEGLRGFYSSASLPSYLKVAPSIGCMYFIFESIMAMPLLPQLAAAPRPAAAGGPAEAAEAEAT